MEAEMGWPRGKSRKEYFAQKKAAEAATKEVMPDQPKHKPEHNAKPASQPEVRAQSRQRYQLSEDGGRATYSSMKSAPKRPNWKMKAGNLWDSEAEFADDAADVLYIPRDVYPEGLEFMWGTRSVRGQDMPQIRNGYRKSGWLEVHGDDFQESPFGEYAKNRWARDESGFVVHEACILLANREEVVHAATQRDKRRAKEQLLIREQSITGGGIAATGANHPSALANNRITKTVERLEIPKD